MNCLVATSSAAILVVLAVGGLAGEYENSIVKCNTSLDCAENEYCVIGSHWIAGDCSTWKKYDFIYECIHVQQMEELGCEYPKIVITGDSTYANPFFLICDCDDRKLYAAPGINDDGEIVCFDPFLVPQTPTCR